MKSKLEKLIREYKYIQSNSNLIYNSGAVSEYQNGLESGKYLMLEYVVRDLKKILKESDK